MSLFAFMDAPRFGPFRAFDGKVWFHEVLMTPELCADWLEKFGQRTSSTAELIVEDLRAAMKVAWEQGGRYVHA